MMSGTSQSPPLAARGPSARPREHFIPPVVTDSLKVGAGAGLFGLVLGATTGVVHGRRPGIVAIVAATQWLGRGSLYYGSRSATLEAWGSNGQLSNGDKVKASGIAGGFAGATVGLLGAGPSGVIAPFVGFSLLGTGGQMLANKWANRQPSQDSGGWLSSKWSPITPLTDRQYEAFLEEKILKLDVEIALLDDKIAALRLSEQQGSKTVESTKPDP